MAMSTRDILRLAVECDCTIATATHFVRGTRKTQRPLARSLEAAALKLGLDAELAAERDERSAKAEASK